MLGTELKETHEKKQETSFGDPGTRTRDVFVETAKVKPTERDEDPMPGRRRPLAGRSEHGDEPRLKYRKQ